MSGKIHPEKDGVSVKGIALALALFVAVSAIMLRVGGNASGRGGSPTEPPSVAAPADISPEKLSPPPPPPHEEPVPAAAGMIQQPEQVAAPAPAPPAPRPTQQQASPPAQSPKSVARTQPPASVSVRKVESLSPTKPSKLIAESELPPPAKPATVPPAVEKVDAKSIADPATAMWYSVRVGYTESKMRADILRDVLRDQGFPKAETIVGNDNTYFVSLGDFNFRYQAEQVSDSVKERTSLIPMIHEKTVAK